MRQRWQKIKDLFEACLAIPMENRSAFLSQECKSDEALRQTVEDLLANDGRSGRPISEVIDRAVRWHNDRSGRP